MAGVSKLVSSCSTAVCLALRDVVTALQTLPFTQICCTAHFGKPRENTGWKHRSKQTLLQPVPQRKQQAAVARLLLSLSQSEKQRQLSLWYFSCAKFPVILVLMCIALWGISRGTLRSVTIGYLLHIMTRICCHMSSFKRCLLLLLAISPSCFLQPALTFSK